LKADLFLKIFMSPEDVLISPSVDRHSSKALSYFFTGCGDWNSCLDWVFTDLNPS
jgi:hypothetical protein